MFGVTGFGQVGVEAVIRPAKLIAKAFNAALGQRATLSYQVYLSLSEEPTGLHVLVHESQPGSDEDQLTAISYPTVLAIVRTNAIDVAFHLQPPVQRYEPTLEQETMRREAYEFWLSEQPEARQS